MDDGFARGAVLNVTFVSGDVRPAKRFFTSSKMNWLSAGEPVAGLELDPGVVFFFFLE
jgi:hypothetical protein